MDCSEIRPQLELFVLGGLDPSAAADVRAHLAGCPDCREVEREYRLLTADVRRGAPESGVRPAFVGALRQAVAGEIRADRHRRRARRIILGVGSAAAAAVLVVALWQAWPLLAGGSGRSAGVAAWGRAGAVRERWHHGGASAEPASAADGVVVRGGRMYFLRKSGGAGRVAAIDLASGRTRWVCPADSVGYLAADGSRVYCLAAAGPRRVELLALDAGSGAVQWRYPQTRANPLVAPCRAEPVGGGRLAWVAGATVHLMDAATGRPIWKHPLAAAGAASAATGEDGRLFVAGPAMLHCLDAATGREAWHVAVASEHIGFRRPLLALADGAAYVVHHPTARRSVLRCLDLRTRGVLWQRALGEVRHVLATRRGVYLRGQDVRAYDPSGRRLWTRDAGGCSPLTADEGLLYLTDSRQAGRLLALDQRSGGEAWQMVGIRSCDAFRRVGQTGYVKTQDGVIRAIALRTP